MSDEDPTVEWDESERRALAALSSEAAPPPEVEDRVVSELAARGVVRRLAARPHVAGLALAVRIALAVAASVAIFAAGLEAGRQGTGASGAGGVRPPAPRFALFLLDEPPGGRVEEPARVAEYKRWAAGLRRGRLVAGEKLGDATRLLTPEGRANAEPAEGALRGYFVIEAPDLAQAVEVARTCPHLKRGGRILVRPIVPV